MGLLGTVKRYKNRLIKQFGNKVQRKQFNFYCDGDIIVTLKALGSELGSPIYPLAEHCLQLGILEVLELTQDRALRDELCRHLVQDHLLTPVTKPQTEPISRRLTRLQNVQSLLSRLEILKSPHEQREIILELFSKVGSVEGNEG